MLKKKSGLNYIKIQLQPRLFTKKEKAFVPSNQVIPKKPSKIDREIRRQNRSVVQLGTEAKLMSPFPVIYQDDHSSTIKQYTRVSYSDLK